MKQTRPQWHLHLLLVPLTADALLLWSRLKMALRPSQDFDTSLTLIPSHFDLSNFREVMDAPYFWQQLFNSVLISVATTVVGIFLSCTAAYAFSRYRFPGRRAGMMALLMTQMFQGR